MSFLETLLDGRTAQEKKQKQTCAIVISVTAILLVVAIIAFAICQVIDATSNNNSDENGIGGEAAINLGEMTTETRSENMITTGNLLTLDNKHHFKGRPELINIYYEGRFGVALSVLPANRKNFEATPETAEALSKLVADCYAALNDDNLIVSAAFDSSVIDNLDAIYSSGETVALDCFAEEGSKLPINEVDKYKWVYNNAYKYGFVLASAKSNVFRYIGNDTPEKEAHLLAAKNMGSLDKYLKELKNATPDNPLKLDDSGSMVAYTCPVNNIKVPKNYKWEIKKGILSGRKDSSACRQNQQAARR